ncbi:MAG TPA: c-type cytochrome [Gemmatimonadaceae bacterium]|nr:c-type cytochrome [Gemmatimonadaceae bacterium]
MSGARRHRLAYAGAALVAIGACVPARGAPRQDAPVLARRDTGSVPGSPSQGVRPQESVPARPDPFAGADLSPKRPVTPVSPSDEQQHFLLPPGYRMTPILTEPAIQQPAAISFDGNGRMFVLELRSYMLDADARDQLAPVSRISRWEDRNNDGVYETHTVFADSLVFPRFATPYGANAILTMESNSNDVFKLTDTNGDGRADKKELFTTNFGRLANVEHLQSSLFWSMDNWLYSTVNAFRVRETKTGVIREPTGFNGAQWGASQDDDGKQWFQGGASGVPSYFQFPIAYGTINDSTKYEPGFDDIWGAPMGLADMQGGMTVVRMPDGSLAKATAGSGSNVYRGGRLPADLIGDYFYGEVVGRVVRRARPIDVEGLVRLRNVYQPEKAEFIRSRDPLFRPVEIKSAPDGSMYIVDMYHGVIQESQWTPKGSYLRAKVEQYQLDKIVGLGRIWRLTHDATPRDTTRPRMYDERPAQLVRHLRHPNGWWRDMAQEELVLRQDRSVVRALKTMARRDTMLVARFHALWTLEGLGALDAALAREAMSDRNPRMRIQAIRASETLYKSGDTTFAADYRRLARDPSVDVVLQAMLTMNTLRVPDAANTIRATVAANNARGVQLVGAQLLNPAANLAGRGFPAAQRAVMERGATAFKETCAQCHGETGLGTPVAGGGTVAPAFAGSPRVTGHPDYVTSVLLHGLTGPIEGKTYAGQIMVSQAQQSDEWIAAVASYIRNTFTNQASFVTPAQVAAVRAATRARTTAWTYPELASTVPVLMQQQSTWKASASHNGDLAVRAFGTAGWSSMVPQQAGMWFQFELPQPVTLAEIQLQSPAPFVRPPAPGVAAPPPPPPRHPRAYRVQVSMDGTTWSAPVADGQGSSPSMTIAFAPVKAKFVRITQTDSTENPAPWYMQQIQLYEVKGR